MPRRRYQLAVEGMARVVRVDTYAASRAEVEAWIARGVQEFGLDWRVQFSVRFRLPSGHYGSGTWKWIKL